MYLRQILSALILCGFFAVPAAAQVLTYGDMDALGTGAYGATDPTAGATLVGLLTGSVTTGSGPFGHGYPFSPGVGEFPGTDQIYVGSTQTGVHDGYATFAGRLNGPQVLTLDYNSLVPVGHSVTSLTLGIAADDFQFPFLGQPFTASINGVPNVALTNQLNAMDQSGPVVQFFTIGLDPSLASPSNVLTLTIDQGGDGGDGWAVDFLTLGVTTAIPEPGTFALAGLGLGTILLGGRRYLRRRQNRRKKSRQGRCRNR
ncbi:MAG: PEP-CTERM sorting domain-containing protein [Gemmatales bacterium]